MNDKYQQHNYLPENLPRVSKQVIANASNILPRFPKNQARPTVLLLNGLDIKRDDDVVADTTWHEVHPVRTTLYGC